MSYKLVPVDIIAGGEQMYVRMRKPTWCLYQWRWWKLFIGIATWRPWRWHEEGWISPKTAWDVCNIIHNYKEDLFVWENAGIEPNVKEVCK